MKNIELQDMTFDLMQSAKKVRNSFDSEDPDQERLHNKYDDIVNEIRGVYCSLMDIEELENKLK